MKAIKHIYEEHYKKLLIIPFTLLILAIIQIAVQTAVTGDFVNKGVTLKGGTTITIIKDIEISNQELQDFLKTKFPKGDISVRSLAKETIVEADAQKLEEINAITAALKEELQLTQDDYTVETMGSSLGASFFRETFKAVIIAFLFMGLIVFFYFCEELKPKIISTILTVIVISIVYSTNLIIPLIIALIITIAILVIYTKYSIPSVAVILAAFSDIIITVSIVNLLGIKLSTAGIAAFLMLIGYSVDTDILLSTRVVKRKEGTIMERIYSSVKTGMTMTLTTIVAIIVVLIFSRSEVLDQIMTIVLIGLFVDLINTWIQNTGLLRWFMEKKYKHHEENE